MKNKGKLNIILDGPPGHESGRFVEVEDQDGRSMGVGEWNRRPDGLWALSIDVWPFKEAARDRLLRAAIAYCTDDGVEDASELDAAVDDWLKVEVERGK